MVVQVVQAVLVALDVLGVAVAPVGVLDAAVSAQDAPEIVQEPVEVYAVVTAVEDVLQADVLTVVVYPAQAHVLVTVVAAVDIQNKYI